MGKAAGDRSCNSIKGITQGMRKREPDDCCSGHPINNRRKRDENDIYMLTV